MQRRLIHFSSLFAVTVMCDSRRTYFIATGTPLKGLPKGRLLRTVPPLLDSGGAEVSGGGDRRPLNIPYFQAVRADHWSPTKRAKLSGARGSGVTVRVSGEGDTGAISLQSHRIKETSRGGNEKWRILPGDTEG